MPGTFFPAQPQPAQECTCSSGCKRCLFSLPVKQSLRLKELSLPPANSGRCLHWRELPGPSLHSPHTPQVVCPAPEQLSRPAVCRKTGGTCRVTLKCRALLTAASRQCSACHASSSTCASGDVSRHDFEHTG